MLDKYEELFNSLSFDIAKMLCPSTGGCPSQGQIEVVKGWMQSAGYGIESLRERLDEREESESR